MYRILISIFFVTSYSRKIQKDAFASIENNLQMVNDTLNTQINIIDTLSQNVIYSNLVKDTFASYLHYQTALPVPDKIDTYTSTQNSRILCDMLFSIIGPNQPADQVYLYGMDSGTFGVGLDNSSSIKSASSFKWYSDTLALEGQKNIFIEKNPHLSHYYSQSGGDYFLSFTKVFYDIHNNPQGIVEVKKNLSNFISMISSLNYPDTNKIYIFHEDDTLFYPLTSDQQSDKLFDIISTSNNEENNVNYTHDGTYYYYYYTSSTGFTTAASINRYSLFSSVYDYIITSFLVLLLVCIVVVIVSYFVAFQISKPIKNMYNQVCNFRLNENNSPDCDISPISTSIMELQTLQDSLIKMQQQILKSVQRELQLQQRENQAKMLALHAQMNPHFLYNSLAVIQTLSDENKNSTIRIFCRNISNTLRYISSNDGQLVEIEKELLHTENYLQCMKIRYESKLSYSIQIPEDMYSIMIPKLSLQMLAENAIKYSTRVRSPWDIRINGKLTSSHWEISISDNGPGFSDEILSSLNKQMNNIHESGIYPDLKIDGMGLMNAFIRFKILYNGREIFKLKNHLPNGAIVTIGEKLGT